MTGEPAHHIAAVLRLGAGQTIRVFDGAGHEWIARIDEIGRRALRLTVEDPCEPAPEPAVRVTLAVGVLKGDHLSEVVKDATALGATRIVPFVSRHTAVGRLGAWADRRQRWQRVAVASAAQCGRAIVPEVSPVVPFEELMRGLEGHVIFCVEPALSVATDSLGAAPAATTVCIGPEGGWQADELDRARQIGARFLSLGNMRLRAELAPTVALAKLGTLWGWL